MHTQLQTLFHFYCSIAGAHSLVNLNDLNFKKHSMFGCAYRNNMVLGIFESNCTCIVPSAFKQVYGLYRFYPILRDVWKTIRTCNSWLPLLILWMKLCWCPCVQKLLLLLLDHNQRWYSQHQEEILPKIVLKIKQRQLRIWKYKYCRYFLPTSSVLRGKENTCLVMSKQGQIYKHLFFFAK